MGVRAEKQRQEALFTGIAQLPAEIYHVATKTTIWKSPELKSLLAELPASGARLVCLDADAL